MIDFKLQSYKSIVHHHHTNIVDTIIHVINVLIINMIIYFE